MNNSKSNCRHVFLADDDQEDREIFSMAISDVDESITITEAVDGLELIEFLDNSSYPKPDIIFLDLNMPKYNGFDCLKNIMSSESEIKDVKVVILTTSSNPNDIDEAYQYGASVYMVKPTRFEDLKKGISKILNYNWGDIRSKNDFILNYRLNFC